MLGTASKSEDSAAGDSSGLARRMDGEWTVSDQLFRHRPTATAWAMSTAGNVVVGAWYRNDNGTDALIALEHEGELVPLAGEELLSEGDQSAVGAAALGERVIVLGTDTTDDVTTVIGWSVTPAD